MECLQQLLEALEPVVVAAAGDFSQSYEGFSTDTRTVKAGNVFVALSGERFDGHDFVVGAAEAGAVCAIVERKVDAAITQIVVTDSGLAFGLAAKAWRGRFALPLAVVAGSNGKTTTTQMLASILLVRWGAERMCATEGNFNNEVGVPKMLLKLAFEHRGAVIECGMNHRGEMARLADWTRPTVALLTNAQREHQEFLRGVEETARENGLVIAALPESGTAVYPADDACADIWADLALARGVDELTYSTDPDVEADVMGRVENGELVISTDEGDVVRTKLRITGSHNVHNATGAAAAAFAMGIGPEAVAAGLGAFEPVPGRGTRFVGKHLVVIDEAYNANPDSVRAAMNVLAGRRARGPSSWATWARSATAPKKPTARPASTPDRSASTPSTPAVRFPVMRRRPSAKAAAGSRPETPSSRHSRVSGGRRPSRRATSWALRPSCAPCRTTKNKPSNPRTKRA